MGKPMTDAAQAEREYAAAAAAGMESDNNDAYIAVDALGGDMIAEFERAVLDRNDTEMRWLKDLRQYRGVYEPEVETKIGANRSKAFVRATRVKVKTVDARVADLLFPSTSDRNWTAEPTPSPSIDRDMKRAIVARLTDELQRRPTEHEIKGAIAKVVKEAATGMTRVIDDQLAESRYKETARHVLHSAHLYGTGVLKGPLVERKTRIKFVIEKGIWVMKTQSYVVPFVDFVPLWRFYPDMSATDIRDCRYVFERHLMTRAALAELAKKKSFDGQKIRDYIEANPNGTRRAAQYENEIRDIGSRSAARTSDDGQYEVIERWGWIEGEKLSAAGVVVPPERMHETFFSNAWMLPDGTIIKVALNPINGTTYPYYLYYADKDETSIFGDGFASVIRDDQDMINAATRMVLDNAAITAGPQIEANMSLLAPSELADDMYPFKIWRRNGTDAGNPAIRVLDLHNGLEELVPIVEMFKANSDDVSAIPRYMQGENATRGAAGTASGMSMLLANASIVMKDLITNYDEGVTRPFVEALYRWNMQFNPDNAIKGDFDIKARGTASLMAKELRAQQLDQFATTIGPEDAPYIKREELLRQRAEAHDLSSIVKTEEEVKIERDNPAAKQQAALAQQMQDLQMQLQQGELAKLQALVAKTEAEVGRIQAETVKAKVDTAYAAMQAGGVATERPEVAPAGDAILKSADYQDATPREPTPSGAGLDPSGAAPIPAPAPAIPPGAPIEPRGGQAGANVGGRAGIETPVID